MRLWHAVEVNKTLIATSKDGFAVDVVVGINRRVEDVRRLALHVNNFDVALLGQVADTVLVLFRKVFAQKELRLRMVPLCDQSLLCLFER